MSYEARTHQPRSGQSELIFENRWSNGLCDCFSDCKACCCLWWCAPCFLCKFDENSKECMCTSNSLMFLFGAFVIPLMMQRSKLRGAYKINGSVFEDFWVVLCCFCCSVLQMHNEMKYRGDAD